jgi:hypothetical protein
MAIAHPLCLALTASPVWGSVPLLHHIESRQMRQRHGVLSHLPNDSFIDRTLTGTVTPLSTSSCKPHRDRAFDCFESTPQHMQGTRASPSHCHRARGMCHPVSSSANEALNSDTVRPCFLLSIHTEYSVRNPACKRLGIDGRRENE